MPVRHIDHILIAMPAGREEEARAFYGGVLGMSEKAKPPVLAARGGCWFTIGALEGHLGVDKNFIPARKTHPAFIVDDLAGMIEKAVKSGYNVTADEPLEGCDRRHVDDPFGNRIELIEPHTACAQRRT
jgi:predicted enzyme related to lactoylglutathione lyase